MEFKQRHMSLLKTLIISTKHLSAPSSSVFHSISPSSPESSPACISKGSCISKPPRSHGYYLFPSSRRDRRSDIPWKCFYLRVFSALLQCHQNIKTLKPRCKRFPQGLLQEKFISQRYFYRVHARVRVHGPGGQCQVLSWVAFDFIYWRKVSHWIRSLSISQIGCPGSPLDPKTLLPTTEFLGSITPGFLHGCWESELRFSHFTLRKQELHPLKNPLGPAALVFWCCFRLWKL